MLKVYNTAGNFKRVLSDIDYRDLTVVSTLRDGDKQLSFTYFGKPSNILNEYYIETETDRYVVKEVHPGDHGTQYVCKLDLEALEQGMFQIFTASKKTVTEAAALALVGTGWTVSSTMLRKRSIQQIKKSPLQILRKIADVYMAEIKFDTVNRVVTFEVNLGRDRGVYMRTDLNLRSLTPTYDSYDYYTRLIPIGADGLQIDNGGKNYVENYSYSHKIRTLIWEDSSYDDASELMADATDKLADLAAPKRSYSASIIDFARLRGDSYLSFGLGDVIKLTDAATEVMEKQRIVKITEYPDNPEKNTVELSNTTLTWEELQDRYRAAADAWEDVSNSDGSVNGVYVHGVQAGDVVGVEVVTGSGTTTTNLQGAVNTIQANIATDIQAVTARIGTVEATYLQATMANIDTANINKLKVAQMFANVGLIDRAVISEGKITGYLDAVQVDAAKITTGTLVTDRLVIRGTNKSIIYAINNISGAVQAQNVNTINGEILTNRTINATKIVASSITANEITTENLVGTNGWINLRRGRFDFGDGRLSWNGSVMTVGNWTVLTNRLEIDKTSSGGYRTGLQCLSDGTGAAFYAGCSTPAGGTIASESVTNFYVTHNGYMFAKNAKISGTITATSGSMTSCSFSACAVSDTLYVGASSTRSGISGNNGTLYLNAAYAGGTVTQLGNAIQSYGAITGYGRYVHMSYAIGSGEQARFRLTNTTAQASGVTAGCVQLSSTGAFGLYNITNSRWLIYDNGTVTMPSATTVSGAMTFSNSPYLNNNIYLRSYDSTGFQVPIIGLSSGNKLFLGPYGSSQVWPDRIVIGNTIGNIYCLNSSGNEILLSTAISDRRLKHDIADLSGARDLIMGLSAKSYRLNGDNRLRYGFIAQDVRGLIPDDCALLEYNALAEDGICDRNDESTFQYSMDYIQIIAPLVALIQEHEREIARLKEGLA